MNIYDNPTLPQHLRTVMRLWGKGLIRTLWNTRSLQFGLIRSFFKRRRSKKQGTLIPIGIGFSPTRRCNLECLGCYARFHSQKDEMPVEVVDSFIGSAADAGVFLFVITGGEPYLREEMFDIYKKYKRVLFLTVTNGTQIDEETAHKIAGHRNILPVISIEGNEVLTDHRRGDGTYRLVLKAMENLRNADVMFGFSSVLTKYAIEVSGSHKFIRNMVDIGCTIGFYNDFIPIDEDDHNYLPSDEQKKTFKDNLNSMRKTEPIVLVHLPDDEYDEEGRCTAVGGGSFHVNAQGYVEPCPFAHFARENVKTHSFEEIINSPFLKAIREHPTALIKGEVGCSLVNNFEIMKQIAEITGAVPTEGSEINVTLVK